MFIVENTDTVMNFNDFPEITDWSNDSYNILEASLFFNEELNKITQATAVAEVIAYNEGTIESFNEGAFETVKNKIKQLWEKFKAFVSRVTDRLLAWIRKTFTSNESFWSKYGDVIEDNMPKVKKKNPKFKIFDVDTVAECYIKLDQLLMTKFSGKEEEARNQYDEKIDELNDIKKDMNTAIDSSETVDFKEITSKFKGIAVNKNTYKQIESDAKQDKKDLEKKIKECEDKAKSYKNAKGVMLYNLLSAKLQKECLTAELNAYTRVTKKTVQLATNIAYEAVKLQNTKEEDVKEESASIDLLNKYLQRI